MAVQLDVDMRVIIREDSPVHPGKKATITRLGLGSMEQSDDSEDSGSWVVIVDEEPKEKEIPARYLIPIPEDES